MSPAYAVVKRTCDIVVATAGLLCTAPVQVAVAALVRRDVGRPVLFRQPRPGRDGVVFHLVKFRTMRTPAGVVDVRDDGARLTALGSRLRAASLDELPTLWNVLRGDMSLVGPRPLLVQYLDRYTPSEGRRHEVRPGITGLAQAAGRNALTWEERLALDVRYVDEVSLRMDLGILLRSLRSVLRREGISAPGEATMAEFRRDVAAEP